MKISLRTLLILVSVVFLLLFFTDYCSRRSVNVVLFNQLSDSTRNNRIDELQELASLRSKLEDFLIENGFELRETFLQNQDINDPSTPADALHWDVDVRDYVLSLNDQEAYRLRSRSLLDFCAIELKFQGSNTPFWYSEEMIRKKHSEIRHKIDKFWNSEIKEVSIDFLSNDASELVH